MNLANPVVAPELRFFLGLIFQYVIGVLIASGHLDPTIRDQLVSQLVDFTGYLIILVTSGIGLFHLAKTSHRITSAPTPGAPAVTKLEITETPATPASPQTGVPTQQTPSVDGGTPLSAESVLGEVETLLQDGVTQ